MVPERLALEILKHTELEKSKREVQSPFPRLKSQMLKARIGENELTLVFVLAVNICKLLVICGSQSTANQSRQANIEDCRAFQGKRLQFSEHRDITNHMTDYLRFDRELPP